MGTPRGGEKFVEVAAIPAGAVGARGCEKGVADSVFADAVQQMWLAARIHGEGAGVKGAAGLGTTTDEHFDRVGGGREGDR
jgi:hypothetical protein